MLNLEFEHDQEARLISRMFATYDALSYVTKVDGISEENRYFLIYNLQQYFQDTKHNLQLIEYNPNVINDIVEVKNRYYKPILCV